MSEPGSDNRQLLLGIDLGTSRTALVADDGRRFRLPSVVGYPRDIIAIRMLGKTQVFGEEALANRSALVLYHPVRDGLTKDGGRNDYNAAFELLQHAAAHFREDNQTTVKAVIGLPARTSPGGRQALREVAQHLFSSALVINEPLLVAYHLERLANSLIVDIGAATVSICALKGAAPSPRDQAVLLKAGNYLDERLCELVNQSHPEVRITPNLARQIKEKYAFVGQSPEPVLVTLRDRGKPRPYDLTSEVGTVCESIVPEIVEQLLLLFKDCSPEDQETVLQNIYLAGGGSRITGLDRMIARALAEYGEVRVRPVEDPDYAGALGALNLARRLPAKDWRQLAEAPLTHDR